MNGWANYNEFMGSTPAGGDGIFLSLPTDSADRQDQGEEDDG